MQRIAFILFFIYAFLVDTFNLTKLKHPEYCLRIKIKKGKHE